MPHVEKTNCNIIFTSRSLLPTFREVGQSRSIEYYLFDVPSEVPGPSNDIPRLANLVEEDSGMLGDLEEVKWSLAQGREQVAYLCPTSGTSGKQVSDSS